MEAAAGIFQLFDTVPVVEYIVANFQLRDIELDRYNAVRVWKGLIHDGRHRQDGCWVLDPPLRNL